MKCVFCELRKKQVLKFDDNVWVRIPDIPHVFGHLILITNRHVRDITCGELSAKERQSIVDVLIFLSKKMKRHLRLNGRKCERIYISTIGESENTHLHFHLIPRFEGENSQGFTYLFAKEQLRDMEIFNAYAGTNRDKIMNLVKGWLKEF